MELTCEHLGAQAGRLLELSSHDHAPRFEVANLVLAKLALAIVSLLVRQPGALVNGCCQNLHASVQ